MGSLVLSTSGTLPFLGADISPLSFLADSVDEGILRVKIGAPGRWELPQDKLFTNTVRGMTTETAMSLHACSILKHAPGVAYIVSNIACICTASPSLLPHCSQLGALTCLVSVCCLGRTDGSPLLQLKYSASPFGFAVVRTDGQNDFPLFNTARTRLVFKVDWHFVQVLGYVHLACQVH